TDTPGLLRDGRIGVLLPDTPPEGAWKVATDVSEVYPVGLDRPECDVLVYPPHRPAGHRVEPVEGSEEVANDPVAAPADHVQCATSEVFFAKPMPRWKRALDLAGASLGLIASAPIMLAAAAAIKLTSPGP